MITCFTIKLLDKIFYFRLKSTQQSFRKQISLLPTKGKTYLQGFKSIRGTKHFPDFFFHQLGGLNRNFFIMLCYPCISEFCPSMRARISQDTVIMIFSHQHSVTTFIQIPADKLVLHAHALDCLDKIQSSKSSLISIKQYQHVLAH